MPGDSQKIIPPKPVDSTQWVIVKVSPEGKELVIDSAWSEADAQRKVDDLAG